MTHAPWFTYPNSYLLPAGLAARPRRGYCFCLVKDAEIDTSDIPEVVNWPDAQRGLLSPRTRNFELDRLWPVIPGGTWPPGFTASREQIYDEFGRLTGGPQDDPELEPNIEDLERRQRRKAE